MSNIDNLRRKVLDIQQKIKENNQAMDESRRLKNTTAVCGTYSNGTVKISGAEYDAVLASRDINLVDGCIVYCLPTAGGKMSIIGGGVV